MLRIHKDRIAISIVYLFLMYTVSGVPVLFADEIMEGHSNIKPPENIAPLDDLLRIVEDSYPGKILEIEMEKEEFNNRDVWIYEVKLLTHKGKVYELEYNAITLELLNTEH